MKKILALTVSGLVLFASNAYGLTRTEANGYTSLLMGQLREFAKSGNINKNVIRTDVGDKFEHYHNLIKCAADSYCGNGCESVAEQFTHYKGGQPVEENVRKKSKELVEHRKKQEEYIRYAKYDLRNFSNTYDPQKSQNKFNCDFSALLTKPQNSKCEKTQADVNKLYRVVQGACLIQTNSLTKLKGSFLDVSDKQNEYMQMYLAVPYKKLDEFINNPGKKQETKQGQVGGGNKGTGTDIKTTKQAAANQAVVTEEQKKQEECEILKGDLETIVKKYQNLLLKHMGDSLVQGITYNVDDIRSELANLSKENCSDEVKKLRGDIEYYDNLYKCAKNPAYPCPSKGSWNKHDDFVAYVLKSRDDTAVTQYKQVLDKYMEKKYEEAATLFKNITVYDWENHTCAEYFRTLAQGCADDDVETVLGKTTKNADCDDGYYDSLSKFYNSKLSDDINAAMDTKKLSGDSINRAAKKNTRLYNSDFIFWAHDKELTKGITLRELGTACLTFAQSSDSGVTADDCKDFLKAVIDEQ